MDTLETIMTRTSIRRFTDRKVSGEDIRKILKAAMSGPSCVNSRDWAFLAVDDPVILGKMAEANGQYAWPLKGCSFAVLVCGDLERAHKPAKEYWIIDGSIAAQNMILAAKSLGIGSVWLGIWPQTERVQAQAALFSLPDHIIPHSVIAFGYPAEHPDIKAPEWDAERVHFNKW